MGLAVLLVDDEKGVRDSLCGLFEDLGHLAESASSGEEALSMVREKDYDLILMDYMMGHGKLNGLDATKQIRQINPRVPIYIHSSNEFKKEQLMEAGATGYIQKGSDSQMEDIMSVLKNSSPME